MQPKTDEELQAYFDMVFDNIESTFKVISSGNVAHNAAGAASNVKAWKNNTRLILTKFLKEKNETK